MSDAEQVQRTGAAPAAAPDTQSVAPRKPSTEGKLNPKWSAAAAAIAFAASLGLGRYVASTPTADARSEVETSVAAPQPQAPQAKPPAMPAAPMDPSVYRIPVSISQPRLGPAEPLATIIQWCDFPDPACAAAEPALQAVLKRHPDDVALVFRHFMKANDPDSERAHQFTRSAFEYGGKFWEARALMLDHKGPFKDADFERMTKKLKLDWKVMQRDLTNKTHMGHVTSDRVFATMFDVTSSPSFFVNGRPLQGPVTEQALEKLVTEEIARAKQLVDKGTPKAEVYAELTKNGTWKRPPIARRPE